MKFFQKNKTINKTINLKHKKQMMMKMKNKSINIKNKCNKEKQQINLKNIKPFL